MGNEIPPGHPAAPERQGLLHRGAVTFFLVSFGFAWAGFLAVFLLRKFGYTNPMLLNGLVSLCMFGPALGAVIAQRQRGEAVLAPLGVLMRPNRWWFLAWLAAPGLMVLVGVVSLGFPSVTLSLDFSGLLERVAPGLTPAQLAKFTEQLHVLPASAFLGAPFQWIRERGGSVIAVAVLHGTINASADLPLLFVRGGSDLVVGITGLAGGIVLLGINAVIWFTRRWQSLALLGSAIS